MGEGDAHSGVKRSHGLSCDAHGERACARAPWPDAAQGDAGSRMARMMGSCFVHANVSSDVLVVAGADGQSVLERESDSLRRRSAGRLLYVLTSTPRAVAISTYLA